MAGLIVTASGIGAGALLYGLVPDSGVYLVAAMPTAVGAALLLYGFVVAPRSAVTGVGASRDPVQDEERRRQKQIEGYRLAGLIVTASGIGAGALLYGLIPESGVYFVAALPTAVGAALLLYGFVVAPRSTVTGVGASRDPVQDEERRRQKQIEGYRLAGLIVTASGIGAGALLYGLVPDSGVYLVAAMPAAVGAALLLYGFVVAPRSGARGK